MKVELEAEAVDGTPKEAEVGTKENLTAVASLVWMWLFLYLDVCVDVRKAIWISIEISVCGCLMSWCLKQLSVLKHILEWSVKQLFV